MSIALDRRIAFFSPTATVDGYGGTESGWTPEFTVWADVKYLRGSEAVMASRLEGKRPAILTVRKSSATTRIKTDWKANFDGIDYNIRENPKMGDHRTYYEFLAIGGVAVGV